VPPNEQISYWDQNAVRNADSCSHFNSDLLLPWVHNRKMHVLCRYIANSYNSVTCIHIYINIYSYVYIYIYVCVYVCVCVCIKTILIHFKFVPAAWKHVLFASEMCGICHTHKTRHMTHFRNVYLRNIVSFIGLFCKRNLYFFRSLLSIATHRTTHMTHSTRTIQQNIWRRSFSCNVQVIIWKYLKKKFYLKKELKDQL